MPRLGFEGGFFNVEFLVPEDGPAQIIEVNGRIASQFAPLLLELHGRLIRREEPIVRGRRVDGGQHVGGRAPRPDR